MSKRMQLKLLAILLIIQIAVIITLASGDNIANNIVLDVGSYEEADLPVTLPKRIINQILSDARPAEQNLSGILIIYISPNCGNCASQATNMKSLVEMASEHNVYCLLSGPDDLAEIQRFSMMYNIPIPLFPDTKLKIARLLKISITPKYSLINNAGQLIAINYDSIRHIIQSTPTINNILDI